MARSNGGIIGKTNKTSFGKCTVTSKTSSGCLTLQPGTRVIKAGGSGIVIVKELDKARSLESMKSI